MKTIYEPSGRALEYSLLALNIYSGCVHGCDYCYVPSVTRQKKEKFHEKVSPRRDIIKFLERDAPKYDSTDKRVLMCFTSDPYPPNSETTREVIRCFKRHNIPFQILTKAGQLACRDFDMYDKNDAFATTMTFMNFQKSQEHEPKAALPDNRCEAIMEAKLQGIQTWVSLEPVLDPEETLEVIRSTHAIVDLFKIGKLNHATSNIDWRRFGIKAIELCEKYKTPYYIKEDLAAYLNDVPFTSVDTRRIT